jgi:hypothetical protein
MFIRTFSDNHRDCEWTECSELLLFAVKAFGHLLRILYLILPTSSTRMNLVSPQTVTYFTEAEPGFAFPAPGA